MRTRQTYRDGDGAARLIYFLAASAVLVPVLGLIAVTSYLRLGADTAALRDAALASVDCRTKVVANVGPVTMGVARLALGFVDLPPEARAAIASARAAEVGVYELAAAHPPDRAAIMRDADRAMGRRGWTRLVGAAREDDLVMVYVPNKGLAEKNMRCCVLVSHEGHLVVASARANIRGLMELASHQWQEHQPLSLAARH